MFNPGDLVALNGSALMRNIDLNGQLFPDLTAGSVLRVKYQRNASVYIDTTSTRHSVLHFSWLRYATEDEIAAVPLQEPVQLGSPDNAGQVD